MSGASSWVKNKKKVDLKELCDAADIDSDGFKPDLEVRLQEYLDTQTAKASKIAEFDSYFASIEAKSPTKSSAATTKRRKTIAPPTSDEDDSPEPRKVSQRTLPSSSGSVASTLPTRTPRTIHKLAQSVPLPPSPAQVATAIERGAAALRTQLSSASSRFEFLGEYPMAARYALSNVQSLNFIFLALEFLFLIKALIPLTYEIVIPGSKVAGTEPHALTLPDFFVLLSIAGFWAPFLTWAFTSVAAPFFISYFVNPTSYPASYPATRQLTKNEKVADPVVFAIARAALGWLVFTKENRLFGLLGDQAVQGVKNSVGLEAVYIGTAVTGAIALYEAILKKK